jgi:Lon protease-like protein
MQRALPPRPNLDHLKSQAKDLLDAHRRRDREAFERIRSAVPAYANKSDDAIGAAPFALHDAQSAIAREYGFLSWAALRANVSGPPKVASPPTPTVPNELVTAALEHRGVGADRPTPRTAPVLPLRNSVVMPGSLVPLDINRATSLRAIEAATQSDPQFIAIFAQRETTTESPTVDDLHPVGTLTILRASRQGDDRLSVVVEGVRWVALDELLQREPYYRASIIETTIDRGDDSSLTDLDRTLRDRARRVADLLGADRENAHALIDATPDPIQLANVVMAHMQLPVADKAAFAAEPDAARRIEHAIAVLDEALRQGPS